MRISRLSSKSSAVKESDFIVPKNSNLFIGGLTGRTGTTWLRKILASLLAGKYSVIGEHGSFVLSQLRNAAYEFYQVTPGSAKNREYYLEYFYEFVMTKAYDRREIYGEEGLKGFCEIVPKRAIKIAFNALERELEDALTLQECNICFGNFYSRLLNYHSLLNGGTLN